MGVSDTEFKQAVEQAFGNGHAHKFRAEYIGVIAGQTRAFYDCSDKFGVMEREANIVADLPVQYGKPEEFKYYKNAFPKLDIGAVSREDLIKTIRKCHQTLWGGGRLSPPMAFGELTKLIFLKTRDEKTPRKNGDPYQFQIKTNETPERLASRIKTMYAHERQKEPDVFNDDIKIDDTTLKNMVLHLEGINLTATDLDTKGVAFEQFMDGFFKGDFGQYFTPRNIIAFAIQILDIQADDFVMDPGLRLRRLSVACSRSCAQTGERILQSGQQGTFRLLAQLRRKASVRCGDQRRNRPRRQNEHDRPR